MGVNFLWMEVVMFRRIRMPAFQLLEAILTLSILSLLFTVGLFLPEQNIVANKASNMYLFEIITQQQKHAFFMKKSITLKLETSYLKIEVDNEKEEIPLIQKCTSNFDLGLLQIRENGNWEKGGSIWCGNQTITIGIGNSVPRIYKTS